jgi:hypothetical protein
VYTVLPCYCISVLNITRENVGQVLDMLLRKHSAREHSRLQQLGLYSSSYGTQMLLQGK